MRRFFNTAGPCTPERHYMLPPERRLPQVDQLVERELYFVLHAPRQSGKTTAVHSLAQRLTAEGHHAALHASCEGGQVAGGDLERGINAVLSAIDHQAEELAAELRPPPVVNVREVPAELRLMVYLSRWAEHCPRPVVLLLDEIDALLDDTLLSVLRQLRSGYPDRPRRFPSSVALIGLRDVRDYKVRLRPEQDSLGTASIFNIKADSLTLRNFTADEIAELYEQHTADTDQIFTSETKARAFELTRGQPWLVNALARQLVDTEVPQRDRPIDLEHVDRAKEALILRRDTHLDSLIDRLREPRVQRILEPILAGELLPPDVLEDDILLAQDLGILLRSRRELTIANPIYLEAISTFFSSVHEQRPLAVPSPRHHPPPVT